MAVFTSKSKEADKFFDELSEYKERISERPKLMSKAEFIKKVFILDEVQSQICNHVVDCVMRGDVDNAALIGEGGTGKTTTVSEIVRLLLQKGKNVHLVAPTHQALSVLQKMIPVRELATSTVAKATNAVRYTSVHDGALGFASKELKFGDTGKPDLIIFDEASFSDTKDATIFLQGIAAMGIFLLAVGDNCQLNKPRTSEVSPLLDPQAFKNKPNNFARLQKVYRTNGRGITFTARKFRAYVERGLSYNYGEACRIINEGAIKYPNDVYLMSKAAFYERFHRPMINSNGGIVYIPYRNALVKHSINTSLGIMEKEYGRKPLYPIGMEVLWYVNEPLIDFDTDKIVLNNGEYVFINRISNSTTTKLLHSENGYNYKVRYYTAEIVNVSTERKVMVNLLHPEDYPTFTALLEFVDAKAKSLDVQKEKKERIALFNYRNKLQSSFLHIRLASTFTGHKSQGNEFPVAIVDIQDIVNLGRKNVRTCNDPFTMTRLMYVAASRASKKVVFLYD